MKKIYIIILILINYFKFDFFPAKINLFRKKHQSCYKITSKIWIDNKYFSKTFYTFSKDIFTSLELYSPMEIICTTYSQLN